MGHAMNTERSTMPGLTLLEVLLACAMLAAIGMAAVSLMRSLSDADRDRRMLVAAPLVMAVANAAFDQQNLPHAGEPNGGSEHEAAPPVPPEPTVVEIDATPRRWVVAVAFDRAHHPVADTTPSHNGSQDRIGPALVPVRFEAVPDAPDWRGTPVVWWRLMPGRAPTSPEQDQ